MLHSTSASKPKRFIAKKTRGGEKISMKSNCPGIISMSEFSSELELATKIGLGVKGAAGMGIRTTLARSKGSDRLPSDCVCLKALDLFTALLGMLSRC
jgi:hypothetical protein